MCFLLDKMTRNPSKKWAKDFTDISAKKLNIISYQMKTNQNHNKIAHNGIAESVVRRLHVVRRVKLSLSVCRFNRDSTQS